MQQLIGVLHIKVKGHNQVRYSNNQSLEELHSITYEKKQKNCVNFLSICSRNFSNFNPPITRTNPRRNGQFKTTLVHGCTRRKNLRREIYLVRKLGEFNIDTRERDCSPRYHPQGRMSPSYTLPFLQDYLHTALIDERFAAVLAMDKVTVVRLFRCSVSGQLDISHVGHGSTSSLQAFPHRR